MLEWLKRKVHQNSEGDEKAPVLDGHTYSGGRANPLLNEIRYVTDEDKINAALSRGDLDWLRANAALATPPILGILAAHVKGTQRRSEEELLTIVGFFSKICRTEPQAALLRQALPDLCQILSDSLRDHGVGRLTEELLGWLWKVGMGRDAWDMRAFTDVGCIVMSYLQAVLKPQALDTTGGMGEVSSANSRKAFDWLINRGHPPKDQPDQYLSLVLGYLSHFGLREPIGAIIATRVEERLPELQLTTLRSLLPVPPLYKSERGSVEEGWGDDMPTPNAVLGRMDTSQLQAKIQSEIDRRLLSGAQR
jgi:hypothetical protein